MTESCAIITGGSRGIGRAIALELAARGHSAAIIYAGDHTAAQETERGCRELGVRAQSYKCDVGDFGQAQAVTGQILTDFGSVGILVNNAGITRDNLILRMSPEDFQVVLAVNLTGAFNMIKLIAPHFVRSRSGRILNVASVAGLTGNAGQANYSSAKAGMIGLTKTVAKELSGRGITCNALAPGFIETDMTAAMSEKNRDAILQSVPLGCAGTPEQVAKAAAFLVSDDAAYITGEVLRVDGGLCI